VHSLILALTGIFLYKGLEDGRVWKGKHIKLPQKGTGQYFGTGTSNWSTMQIDEQMMLGRLKRRIKRN
jgi:hypothetical protein